MRKRKYANRPMNAKAYIPPAPVLVRAANAMAPRAIANTPIARLGFDVRCIVFIVAGQ
jgi:hypothetical protein